MEIHIMQNKDTGGRPPIYNDPIIFNKKVDEYFSTGCKYITIGIDKDGNIIKLKKYTINGLALYLGFSSKQSLYEYGKKTGFIDPIKKARTMIEQMYEEMLASKYSTGAIFALKNMGWKDKTEIDHTVTNDTIKVTIE